MDLNKKIEQLRQQPEHVRVRYVWICVVISMFVVLIVWFFSIASMFAEEKNNSGQTAVEIVPSIDEQFKKLREQAPSLENLKDQSLNIDDESAASADKNANVDQPSTDNADTSKELPSSVYSNLRNTSLSQ